MQLVGQELRKLIIGRIAVYLTDAVEVARSKGLKAEAVVGNEAELLGINTRADLARAEALTCSMQNQTCRD